RRKGWKPLEVILASGIARQRMEQAEADRLAEEARKQESATAEALREANAASAARQKAEQARIAVELAKTAEHEKCVNFVITSNQAEVFHMEERCKRINELVPELKRKVSIL